MRRQEVMINQAKVRKVLKLLRAAKRDNFRVVGAGQWNSNPPRLPK